jgi:hypothetical protein
MTGASRTGQPERGVRSGSGVNNDSRHHRGSSRSSDFPANLKKKGADERTRTAYPCSLRVIHQPLQGVARVCKTPISREVSLLCLAQGCTVLRSRWCQSGVNVSPVTAQRCLIGTLPPSLLGLLRFGRSSDRLSSRIPTWVSCHTRDSDRRGSTHPQRRRASDINRHNGVRDHALEQAVGSFGRSPTASRSGGQESPPPSDEHIGDCGHPGGQRDPGENGGDVIEDSG